MGKAKILVVDDDEALAEMIGIVLRNDGFEPAFAALIGWIVLHQDPSALKLAAIALVISASVNQTLAGRRLRKTMPPAV